MRGDAVFSVLSVVLGAVGTWMLLPHRHGTAKPAIAHRVGLGLVAAALVLLAVLWTGPGGAFGTIFFYGFALAAIAGGVMLVTSRDPVYGALWFAAVILSTCGLFLLAGAQFLAAGTAIVYAGAIIVTFLFVIMLAQAGGQATYDRTARTPAVATICCFVLLWALLETLLLSQHPGATGQLDAEAAATRLIRTEDLAQEVGSARFNQVGVVVGRAVRTTAKLGTSHVASLGGTLYTDHLIVIELAGVVLFVALVGAALIATPKRPVRPRAARAAPEENLGAGPG